MVTWQLVVGALILVVLAGPVNAWLVDWAERAEFSTLEQEDFDEEVK